MRRRKEKLKASPTHKIRTVRPLFFWHRCFNCGDEIRREKMYEVSIRWTKKHFDNDFGIIVHSLGYSTDFFYFCTECCKSDQDVQMELERLLVMYEE